ncbi:hypothetical protein PybrP1_002671 [[Pythium] brassicae (nom. inval.)]|nr:hypothetical protein PybrP1_002671 [[Pythium] brassicae (nom. inval.)]
MSWTATSGYAPALLRKPSSSALAAAADEQEVVVPLVLWGECPRVAVSCVHVLHLPVSQPSQNSNTHASFVRRNSTNNDNTKSADASFRQQKSSSSGNGGGSGATADFAGLQIQIVDDDDDDAEETRFQVCVFAGTVDGVVLYWLFEQDAVVQVNLLVFAGESARCDTRRGTAQPVQGIVSGTDEWGQSIVVSITRDGSVARWQLPNGACSSASATLARQLAPVQGLEMFCNQRYAMVFSEATRMMVLDAWKMHLLYCMDTAQEQIRRSIAVAELRMPAFKGVWGASGAARNPLGATASNARVGLSGPTSDNAAATAGSFVHASSSSASVSGSGSSAATLVTTTKSFPAGAVVHVWDALVVSLGAEGLVKCFLWSKPRTVSTPASVSAGGFQWVQESCWLVSWADDADDITCSQSTSLKDGDHMNPQTALMRSIKSSYFPLAVRLSPDASLLLFIWKTKWVVLKRKWLCKIDGLASGAAGSSPRHRPIGKGKPRVFAGSCSIAPATLLGHGKKDSSESTRQPLLVEPVCWEHGEFVNDNLVVLWTNTGHVFRFASCGSAAGATGKLFIFTKDQDQFVPRSNFKSLASIDKAQHIAYMHQCECCRADESKRSVARQLLSVADGDPTTPPAGFTACVQSAGSVFIPSSPLSPSLAQTRLIHVCKRGSVGFWDVPPTKCVSPPRMAKPHALPVHLYDHVQFHSFSDGFESLQSARDDALGRPEGAKDGEHRRVRISHLLLGREGSGSTHCLGDAQRRGKRRRRTSRSQSQRPTGLVQSHSLDAKARGGSGAESPVPTALSSAIGAAIARAASPPQDQPRRASTTFSGSAPGDVSSQYLMDVPVLAKGYSDGSVEVELLGRKRAARGSASVYLDCHAGGVTAIAHCTWVAPSAAAATESPPLPPSPLIRASTTAGQTEPSASSAASGGIYMSARKAKTWKRGVPAEESVLATDKNPFYRSRFAAPTQRRSWSSRQMSAAASSNPSSSAGSAAQSAPCNPNVPPGATLGSSPAVYFMVFTGGDDGVLRVVELALRPVESTFVCEAIVLQKFRKHRGAIQEIAISPLRDGGGSLASVAPDRLVATVGVDRKVTLFAPIYGFHPNAHGVQPPSSFKGRCLVEWECILELSEHNDVVCDLGWHLERGLLFVECEDRMVYVWNTDTGILERSIPAALLDDSGAAGADDSATANPTGLVGSTEVWLGGASVHLLKFAVIRSAEHIKSSWKAYFYGLSSAMAPPSAVSPYAIGSIELLLLSFLLSWGASPEIDRACRELLGIDAPELPYSCALIDGRSGALTIPVPWKGPGKAQSAPRLLSPSGTRAPLEKSVFARNWQHSSALSANLALGIVSLCMNLMEHKYSKATGGGAADRGTTTPLTPALPSSPKNKEEFHVLWSQLITQHSVVLPDYVPSFREPALEYLATFGFNECDYTQLAARALLNGVIKRLPAGSRSALTAEYSAKLHFEIVRLEGETGSKLNGSAPAPAVDFSLAVARLGSLVVLLSMIGTCYPGEISPAGAREVCDILVYLLKAPVPHVGAVAAELLTKGLMLFRPHLVDLSSLIVQLLLIDMREKQRSPDGSASPVFGSNARVLANGGSNASLSLLVELGACESAFVLALLQQEMNNSERPHAFRECVLLYLTELINTHYLLMFRHLPAVVDTIMGCLDPTKLERRKRCLELSTRCLHSLVRRFPMIDFHKDTQRLAIGTMEAVILIYDLRTATKWRVLDGHASAVSAVSFRADGQILVSYAAREGSVRWWNSGNAGLFGGMLKMQQSCLKEHRLDVLKSAAASAPSSSGGASADLKQVIQTCRFQFLTLKEPSIAAASATELKEKKILRLTREDASQVQFLL